MTAAGKPEEAQTLAPSVVTPGDYNSIKVAVNASLIELMK